MNNNINVVEETPLSDADIKKYFPKAKIISYDKLKNYSSISKLLPNIFDYCFILYQQQKNVGHWVALMRYDNIIEYFDSFGGKIDSPLNWNDKQTNIGLGQCAPYLTNLLKKSNMNVIYNNKKYQNSDSEISTCGRHCCLRILTLLKGYDLDDYYKLLSSNKKLKKMNYDGIVSELINLL